MIDSGREITKIPLKGKKEDGAYPCLICPSLQGHGRGFQRKEDLKRHYQLHFKVFTKFKLFNLTKMFSTLALRAIIASTETLVQII